MSVRTIGFHTAAEEKIGPRRVELPLDFRHACCVGMTGSGKTAGVILPLLEDRIARGHGILFYAYKGNEHARVKALAKKYGRLGEVAEFGKPYGVQVNLMEMFDLPRIREAVLEMCGGKEGLRDPYWPQSAANYAESTARLLRAVHRARSALERIDPDRSDRIFALEVEVERKEDSDKPPVTVMPYLEFREAPSFSDLHRIVSDPVLFNGFFQGAEKLKNELKSWLHRNRVEKPYRRYRQEYRELLLGIVELENAVARNGRIRVSLDASEAGGNDGVRQVLENGLKNIASREYANGGISDLLSAGKILILDIEGIESGVHGVVLELMLSRLASRTREAGEPSPYSVFVDEANRVLSGGGDIHNDVLRESRVELILAYQNEEQMHLRFPPMAWNSYRQNFRYRFEMREGHRVTFYREDEPVDAFLPDPCLAEERELHEAEYAFNELSGVAGAIGESFLLEGERLPERFRVLYNPRGEGGGSSIRIIGSDGETIRAKYLGKKSMELYRSLHGMLEPPENDSEPRNDPEVWEDEDIWDEEPDLFSRSRSGREGRGRSGAGRTKALWGDEE